MGDALGVPSRWFGGILWREFGIGLCMSYIRLLLFAKCEVLSDLQTARQATFSRARANEPPHDPRGHAAPATVEHTDMWSSAHERLTWEVGNLRSATLPETDILALKALTVSKQQGVFLRF